MSESNWSDVQLETMQRLLAEGYSAGMIARMIGNGCTRNVVIGQARRKKWLRPHSVTQKTARGPRIPHTRDRLVETKPAVAKPSTMDARAALVQELNSVELYGPVNDFPANGQCKYIPGDPATGEWQCCGWPTGDLAKHPQGDCTDSWCAAHRALIPPVTYTTNPAPISIEHTPSTVGRKSWRKRGSDAQFYGT